MNIPSPLREQMGNLLSSLSDELYHVEHDIDMDGFASGIITTVALRRMGYEAYPYPAERSKTFVPEKGAIFFTDIALNGGPLDVASEAEEQGKNVYAIDHHPWAERIEKKLKGFVNPHLAGVDRASHWNAGFLAFLTFREHVMDYDWLAAISVYTDHTLEDHSNWLVDRFGFDKVKRAGDLLTAYIAVTNDLSELDYLLLSEIQSIEDVLGRTEFIEAGQAFESAVREYVKNPREHAVLWDDEKRIMVIETAERFRQINSVVSTRISTLPEYRDWIVVVLGRDVENPSILKGSLRCQEYEKRGAHLGNIAGKLAEQLGGKGGGHPMAAGMKTPLGKREELITMLLSLF